MNKKRRATKVGNMGGGEGRAGILPSPTTKTNIANKISPLKVAENIVKLLRCGHVRMDKLLQHGYGHHGTRVHL